MINDDKLTLTKVSPGDFFTRLFVPGACSARNHFCLPSDPILIFAAIGFLLHLSFFFLFMGIGAAKIASFNVFSCALWVGIFLLARRKHRTAAFLLALAEIMAHAFIACSALGLHAGFQLYLLVMTAMSIQLMPNFSLRTTILFSILPLLLLTCLYLAFSDVAYSFQYPEYLHLIFLGNSVCTGTIFLLVSLSLRIENNRQRQILMDMASHDELTGLKNRRAGRQILEENILQAERNRLPFCIVMADIDHFKALNDTFGHETGDMALRSVAHCFRTRLRKTDAICRWGGEEFLFILGNITLTQAYLLVESLRINVQTMEISHKANAPKITLSLGVAQFAPGETVDKLIARADDLLYQAKSKGRNRTEMHSTTASECGLFSGGR